MVYGDNNIEIRDINRYIFLRFSYDDFPFERERESEIWIMSDGSADGLCGTPKTIFALRYIYIIIIHRICTFLTVFHIFL